MSANEQNFVHSDFPHLSSDEWSAVLRMTSSSGAKAVGAMLTTLNPMDQRESIFTFVQREVAEAKRAADETRQQNAELRQQLAQLSSQRQQIVVDRPPHVDSLKIDVAKYRGGENESLLRWLVELEASIGARNIREPLMQVTFAMSNLAGRAKTWAFGRRLADRMCFPTYDDFKMELRQAFEPPKTEFRARAEFLDLKQGKRDIHTYSQLARYLVSCIVESPIDDQTQVVTIMKGLNDSPIKTHLFREYPESMEEAISLAAQEDFSLNQAKVHSAAFRPQRSRAGNDAAEPMDLSAATSINAAGARSPANNRQRQCHRCQKLGHYAHECLAPRPSPRVGGDRRQTHKGGRTERPARRPLNGQGQ